MPGQTVTITYEAFVRGIDQIRELSAKTAELQQQNEQYRQTVQRVTAEHEKHATILEKARKGILNFRKELFAISFTAAAVIGTLLSLGKASGSLSFQLEQAGNELQRFGKNLGDLVAKSGFLNPFIQGFQKIANIVQSINNAVPGGKSFQQQGFTKERGLTIDSLITKTLASQGNTEAALNMQLDLEFLQKIQEELAKGGAGVDQLRQAWVNYRKEAIDALRRTELGLKSMIEIGKEFNHTNVQIFKGGISGAIQGLTSGQFRTKEGMMDFVSGIGNQVIKNIADTIAESIASKLFNGQSFTDFIKGVLGVKDPAKIAEELRQKEMLAAAKSHEKLLTSSYGVLQGIQNCVCAAAASLASMGTGRGTPTISIEGGKGGGALGKIGAIAGLVGAVAGAGAFASAGLGNLGSAGTTGGYNNPSGNNANISMGGGGFETGGYYHTGGFVRSFPTGGEVPAFVQPGEFVVRKSVAQDNKKMLQDMNSGKPVKGSGGHVFLIKANDAQSFADMLSTPSGQQKIEIAVLKAVMGNTQVRKVIKDFAR